MKDMTRLRDVRDGSRRTLGVSLIELLIVLAIGGLLLTMVTAFFGQQARVSRRTQAANELNVRVRTVAEAIAQDLQLAGSRAIVDASGTSAYVPSVDAQCTRTIDGEDVRDSCVVGPTASSLPLEFTVFYASSLLLDPSQSATDAAAQDVVCRRVRYALDTTGTVFRRDVPCSTSVVSDIRTFENEFANDIESVTVKFACADDPGVWLDQAVDCYDSPTGFVREGRVQVVAASGRVDGLEAEVTLSAHMPNMRPPLAY